MSLSRGRLSQKGAIESVPGMSLYETVVQMITDTSCSDKDIFDRVSRAGARNITELLSDACDFFSEFKANHLEAVKRIADNFKKFIDISND